ncbi:MAG TPA: hypothetical protein VG347_04765 [Verrucomicrobiae bacterium]|nr:hypothetical protein [Verrucomicrobiae bacterium]
MSEKNPVPENFREHLAQLRESLLQLHKALVESERHSYEQNIGKIASPGHFLQLLTTDPWFAWLHPVSELIVAIDEALDSKKKQPLTREGAEALLKQIRTLLVATETGEGFSKHYYDAIQRDPDVLYAHAATMKLFHPRKPAA